MVKVIRFPIALVALVLAFLFIGINPVVLDAADLSTTTCPGAGCVTYTTEGQTQLAIQVSGTFTGTLTFYTSVDGTNFVISQVVPVGALATPVTTTTAAGIWTLELKGHKNFRIAFTAYTDGTAITTLRTLSK